jgi:hypothetical protein
MDPSLPNLIQPEAPSSEYRLRIPYSRYLEPKMLQIWTFSDFGIFTNAQKSLEDGSQM